MINHLLIRFNKFHYAVAALALIVFAFGLGNQFNSWDDTVYVTENPAIALSGTNVKNSFLKGETHGMYLPLTALSFSVNYAMSGLSARPYLVTNLLIHLLCIFLVMSFLQKLFKNNTLTLVVGALFALHPMQAESVSYIAGRRDTLYAVFYLLALISYVNHLQLKDKKWVRLTLLFFLLSLFSKGQAIALPATLVLIDFICEKQFSFALSVKSKWLFIALSVVFMIITLVVKQRSQEFNLSGQVLQLSFFERCVFACYGFMMYVVNLVVPFRLSLVHPYPPTTALSGVLLLSLLFTAAFIAVLVVYRSKQKTLVAGLWFFAINIFLVLQLIPNSYGIMNDHYVYIPCIGIFIALYVAVEKWLGQTKTVYAFVALAAVFTFLLSKRIAVFKDNFTVFSDVIKKYPDSPVGYNNRGTAYYDAGRLSEALQDFNRSVSVAPNLSKSYSNRASIYISTGQYKPALADLDKAIALEPDFANAYSNRGIARSMIGDVRALEDLNKAISLNDKDPRLYYNRAGYWMGQNRKEQACADVAKARALGLKGGNPALDKICP